MKINKRIELTLNHLSKGNIKALIIPSNDPHFSEYVADYYKCREFISGFNGSAGTMVITTKGSRLWSDSRYFLQAEQQLNGSEIELMKMGMENTPTIAQWLTATLDEDDKVGFDAKLFSIAEVERLQTDMQSLHLTPISDPFIEIWSDRAALPKKEIMVLDASITGENTTSKIGRLRRELNLKENEVYIVSPLDDVAWLMNIRGEDVNYNPVAIAYSAIELNKQILFIDKIKVSSDIEKKLTSQNIEIRSYNDFDDYIANLKDKTLILNSDKINYHIYLQSVENSLNVKREIGATAVSIMKAIKNKCEIEGFKRAMIEDGIALIKFNIWLEESVQNNGTTSEMEVSKKLEEFRSESSLYKGLSFGSIVGYGQNGALAHYSVTEESSQTIKADGFLLMDSGGQYICGTTDITRTVHLSKPTKQQQIDFTLVLQGNIDLATAIFPTGTRGSQLDILARRPMLSHCINYMHGTGHGVGHFLNVHEGPQSVRKEENSITLKVGMVMSNEPAIYRTGKYGIRTENVIVVVPHNTSEFGEFLKFEPLTLFPIDTKCVIIDMLTSDQRTWLNNYHKYVYDILSPKLSPKEKVWLTLKTKQI